VSLTLHSLSTRVGPGRLAETGARYIHGATLDERVLLALREFAPVVPARHLNRKVPHREGANDAPMRNGNGNTKYINIGEDNKDRRARTPWYWRLIAAAASWMILGGSVAAV
jgi:hypothetical protein